MRIRIAPSVAKRLVWSRPDSHIIPFCSVCLTHISDDDVRTMMWDGDGACVQFCDRCAETALIVEEE